MKKIWRKYEENMKKIWKINFLCIFNKMCENQIINIYLLQEREFIKTKENILKVGMTTKLNHKRFNQYPKY